MLLVSLLPATQLARQSDNNALIPPALGEMRFGSRSESSSATKLHKAVLPSGGGSQIGLGYTAEPTASEKTLFKKKQEVSASDECPACGTDLKGSKNCCAPGGTWHGTCEETGNDGAHTYIEGWSACRCENSVVCKLSRDLQLASKQLMMAEKHRKQAIAGGGVDAVKSPLNSLTDRDKTPLERLSERHPVNTGPAALHRLEDARELTEGKDASLNHIAVVKEKLKGDMNEAAPDGHNVRVKDGEGRWRLIDPDLQLQGALCHSFASKTGQPSEDAWCRNNCNEDYCPKRKCICSSPEDETKLSDALKPGSVAAEAAAEAEEKIREHNKEVLERAREDAEKEVPEHNSATQGHAPGPRAHTGHLGARDAPKTQDAPAAHDATKVSAAPAAQVAPKASDAPASHDAAKASDAPKSVPEAAKAGAPASQDPPKAVGQDPQKAHTAPHYVSKQSMAIHRMKCSQPAETGASAAGKVAVLFAMDIRLPRGAGHCDSVANADCDSQEDVVKLLNGITKGTDVLVATDRAFKDDVDRQLQNVVAVRFTEDIDGGMPQMANQMRQWWRLKIAWELLTDVEQACKQRYFWVFKMRTDANVVGGGTLHDLAMRFDAKVGASRLLTFSDRWFGARRDAMARMATLYDNLPRYQGIYGTCGGCEMVATLLHEVHSSPKSTQMPLPGNMTAHCDPSECIDTAYGRKFCPLREDEKNRLWARTGYAVYLKHQDKGELGKRPWPQPPPEEGKFFCLLNNMKNKKSKAAPAEYTMAMHVLSSGLRPLSWVDAEAGLLETSKQGLYRWRKIIHLWIDGITFGDGPLVPRDDPAAAQIIAAVRLRDSAIAHRDGVSLARQRADLHATVQGAVVGALRWAVNPSDLTPEDEETGQVGDDSWTMVRHALPFRVYGDGPLDFFRHHHAF